ncbi:hypothetical protein [Paraburkholderia sp.]|uniref:hypothetical protein n=1 Tax=Paraburkholderia sp. TaxID=1926495 RepID=UPI002F3F998C
MDGLSRTRRWAWGAVIAALCSFAHAKVPGAAHGGGAYPHRSAAYATRLAMRGGGPYAGVAGAAGARSARASRDSTVPANAGGQRSGADFADANYGYGAGAYNWSARRIAGPSGYADERARMQYAGAITPVSAESRPVPHPPSNMPMRNGSIRADVARYNEERGAGRSLPRPADDSRPPEGSPYRN